MAHYLCKLWIINIGGLRFFKTQNYSARDFQTYYVRSSIYEYKRGSHGWDFFFVQLAEDIHACLLS